MRMDARQIMNNDARWKARVRTAWNCHWAILNVTDYDDWRESGVLIENTLNAGGIMREAMK